MYCRNCGKEIGPNETLCTDCRIEEILNAKAPAQPQPAPAPVQTGSKKEGFGGALTSTILGAVAFFISCYAFGLVLGIMLEMNAGYGSYIPEYIMSQGIILTVISLGMGVPSLILGILGMKTFFRAKNEGRIKPVPTLVCGIIGLASGALTLLMSLTSAFVFMRV